MEHNELYWHTINIIKHKPSNGITIWGQKTLNKGNMLMKENVDKLKEYDELYYNSGTSPISDNEYDKLKETTKKKFPDNSYFKLIGSSPKSNKVKLPFVLGSLKKVKKDKLNEWLKTHGGKYLITEKLDGCLEENTLIETEDGEKTIKKICDSKYTGKIKSFDIFENKISWDNIVGHKIRKNINNWYEIETEDGEKISLTGDHKIYINNLKCWRQVKDLDGTEDLLIRKT